MFTKFGVDISSRFRFRARTVRQTDKQTDETEHVYVCVCMFMTVKFGVLGPTPLAPPGDDVVQPSPMCVLSEFHITLYAKSDVTPATLSRDFVAR